MPAQLKAAEEWVRARAVEHDFSLTADSVRTHEAVAPGRKLDPGEIFPLEDFLAAVVD